MAPGEAPEQAERRQPPRFRIALPVILNDAMGSTRDVSASGVSFTLGGRPAAPPAQGARIGLTLVLDHADPGRPLPVRCDGTVVRVEETAGAVTIALQFDSYSFDPRPAGHHGVTAGGPGADSW